MYGSAQMITLRVWWIWNPILEDLSVPDHYFPCQMVLNNLYITNSQNLFATLVSWSTGFSSSLKSHYCFNEGFFGN